MARFVADAPACRPVSDPHSVLFSLSLGLWVARHAPFGQPIRVTVATTAGSSPAWFKNDSKLLARKGNSRKIAKDLCLLRSKLREPVMMTLPVCVSHVCKELAGMSYRSSELADAV